MPEIKGWTVTHETSLNYEISIAEPLIPQHGELLLSGGPSPGRRFIVCDSGVPEAWLDTLRGYLAERRIDSDILILDGGENCKNHETLIRIIHRMDAFGVERRNEPVIIIGGGAVMDVAALAASLYRRGVPYIKVPTTVLSYVDASVGIKAGINFNQKKNLIGVFQPPQRVLLDRTFFQTLPRREIANALGEVLKLGVGCSAELFNALESASAQAVFEDRFQSAGVGILHTAIAVTIEEIEPNILEDDLCRAVELGHTFSPPWELGDLDHRLRHGEAVALDIMLSVIISRARGLISDADARRVAHLTRRLDIVPTLPDIDVETIWASVLERTRHRAGQQRIPLPKGIGGVRFINDLEFGELEAATVELEKLLA
ncbi:sedoheptulose 7-phosphate cyclase [Nocardia sp. NPDC051832]|uniref:sedoheptulose 7-phosphate cyclase n=1 Tax=Nocardia sp. NPDC051832 TaxID=3155673 RepID=UPI0034402CB0